LPPNLSKYIKQRFKKASVRERMREKFRLLLK